jgi:putative membrane protein insertion efficiency factor
VNLVQHILILAVRIYRGTLSPAKTFLFGPLAGCRFEPSCSVYALEALKRHGAAKGSWLAAKRICRCHPWGGCGHDPVPKQFQISNFKFRISTGPSR